MSKNIFKLQDFLSFLPQDTNTLDSPFHAFDNLPVDATVEGGTILNAAIRFAIFSKTTSIAGLQTFKSWDQSLSFIKKLLDLGACPYISAQEQEEFLDTGNAFHVLAVSGSKEEAPLVKQLFELVWEYCGNGDECEQALLAQRKNHPTKDMGKNIPLSLAVNEDNLAFVQKVREKASEGLIESMLNTYNENTSALGARIANYYPAIDKILLSQEGGKSLESVEGGAVGYS